MPLLDDLPGHGTVAVPAPDTAAGGAGVRAAGRIVAILSGVDPQGPWHGPDATIDILNVLGGTELDLREAAAPAGETIPE